MSYARWGPGSDAYVYLDVGGYLICYCSSGGSHYCTTTHAMLGHLYRHRLDGDQVPQYAFDGLLREAEENDAWMRGDA